MSARLRASAPTALLVAALAVVGRARGDERVRSPGLLRDLLLWAMPAATVAAFVLFVWLTAEMAGDEPEFAPLGIGALAALLGCVAGLVAALRHPRPTHR